MNPNMQDALEHLRAAGGLARSWLDDEAEIVFGVYYPLWFTDGANHHTYTFTGDVDTIAARIKSHLIALNPCPPTCRTCLHEVFVGGNKGKDAKHLAVQVDVIHDVLDEIAHTAPNSNADTIFRNMMRTGDFSAGTLLVWADAVEDALGDEHWANAVRTTAANVRPALNSGTAVRLGND